MTPPPPARSSCGYTLLLLALFGLALSYVATIAIRRAVFPRDAAAGRTTISQAVIVEQTRAVARLVTSETTLRDVVIYQNRRLGSTKRSLVVVTGKVHVGFDLDRGLRVDVDHPARRVHVVLPAPAVLGVEITELKTYDEQRGLWNPFRPADRDSIFGIARRQLVETAGELALAGHAEESARRLVPSLVQAEGYTTEVTFAPRPAAESGPAPPADPAR
jgi:hypothetical protein